MKGGKKLAIIGANEFQTPLIIKANEMDLETHVFAWDKGATGKENADFFYPISIKDKELILNKCREISISGICTTGSDLAILTVNYVARNLGLTCNDEYNDNHATNKYLMRQAFEKKGIPVPKFLTTTENIDLSLIKEFKFPLIVKPTDRSGSRGIYKCENSQEIQDSVKLACQESFEKKAIVEEWFEGNEYSCESISFEGIHHTLAFTKKFTTGAPHFIETGHIEPSDLSLAIQKSADEMINKALDSLHVKYGASHSEFKVTPDGRIRIIEIGSRGGGDCISTDLVYLSTGKDLTKMIIQTAIGEEPDLSICRLPKVSQIRFIFSQVDLDELNRIKNNNTESIWRVSDIEPIREGAVTDSSNRFGYFITVCNNK